MVEKLGKIFGIIAVIAGALGLVLGWAIVLFLPVGGMFGGLTLPIIAIIFGAIGISQDDSKGMGVAGLILGIIGIIVTIVVVVLLPFLLLLGFLSLLS